MTNQVTPVVIREQRSLTGFWRWFAIACTIIGMALVLNQIFRLQLDLLMIENSYHYCMLAFFGSFAFLIYPTKTGGWAKRFFWVDVILFFLFFGSLLFLAWHGKPIIWFGWAYAPPLNMVIVSIILWVLLLETLRRSGNKVLFIFVALFSIYPLFAESMPGLLQGPDRTFGLAAAFHLMSTVSVLGVPLQAVCNLVIGFIIFGVVLQGTGGGKFFIELASAIFGGTRGGPAKVAVVASSLFGSMSGSVIANVTTTGSFTIPAMKSAGYKPEDAGAVETCASTGGVLMPPVMGAVAFVMAALIGRSYAIIALAAAIPSLLYYISLFLQVDAIAAKQGLAGLPKSQIPSLKKTLKEGWIYIISFLVLIYFLFFLRQISQAPFYAIATQLVLSMVRKETRFTLKSFLQFLQDTCFFLADMIIIVGGIGFVLGSLAFTGVAGSFASELVSLAGGNTLLMLLLGALASAILGMGLTSIACYVFLAIVLAPALVLVGYNIIAVHLFVLYWGMISFITPPVALGAIPASLIAKSTLGKTGLSAMRLGGAIYIVPFFFIFQPALVLQAGVGDIISAVALAILGVTLIASSLQGYLLGIGRMVFVGGRVGTYLARLALFISGILLATPPGQTSVLGAAIALVVLLLMLWQKARGHERLNSVSTN